MFGFFRKDKPSEQDKDKPLGKDIEVKNNGVVKAVKKTRARGEHYYAICRADDGSWINDVNESELESTFDSATVWIKARGQRAFLDGNGRYWPCRKKEFIATKRFRKNTVSFNNALAVDETGVVYGKIIDGVPEDGYSTSAQVEEYLLTLDIEKEKKLKAMTLTPV